MTVSQTIRRGKRITIEVEQQDIDDGHPRHSSHCMIAAAIARQLPWAKHIAVDLQTIRFSDPEKRQRYVYLTPRNGQVGLVNWDQGLRPDPFTLVLGTRQVIRMKEKGPRPPKPPTGSDDEGSGSPAQPEPRKRQRTHFVSPPNGGSEAVPGIVGGRAPPIGNYSKRREFGMRAFSR